MKSKICRTRGEEKEYTLQNKCYVNTLVGEKRIKSKIGNDPEFPSIFSKLSY